MGGIIVTPSPPPPATPLATGCHIAAEMDCLILDDRMRPLQECDDIRDPRSVTCKDDLPATSLAFRYLPRQAYPDEVYVVMSGGRLGEVFRGVVQSGGMFRGSGDFRGRVQVEIYTVDNGEQGTELEVMEINTKCEGDSPLTLTTRFGTLELVGFQNAIGYFSSVRDVRMEYFIGNDSTVPLTATSAIISSHFQLPFEALDSPRVLGGNAQTLMWPFTMELYQTVYTETVTVDLGQKFKNGEEYLFMMEATGKNELDEECTDVAEFSF